MSNSNSFSSSDDFDINDDDDDDLSLTADEQRHLSKVVIAHRLAEAREEFPKRLATLAEMQRSVPRGAVHPLDAPLGSGWTMMVAAATANDVAFMETLFDAGASCVASEELGNYALKCAADVGAYDAVRWLLDHGVAPDESGEETPLRSAISKGAEETALLLIERGAALDLGDGNLLVHAVACRLVRAARLIGERAPHLIAAAMGHGNQLLLLACEMADFLPLVRHILEHPDVDLTKTSGEFHPLTIASSVGLLEHVTLLLEHGAPIDQPSRLGTALHAAAKGGHADVVRVLLAAGAAVEPALSESCATTPLLDGVRGGNLDVVRQLVDAGANTRALTKNRKTILHVAAGTGNADLVRFVLPFCDIEQRDADGNTATFWACVDASPACEVVLDALLSAGAKIDVTNGDKLTPIVALAAGGRLHAVQKLVARGVSVHHTTPGNTNLMHYAAEVGALELVLWLMAQGVAIDLPSTALTDEVGETPLFLAAEAGHDHVVEVLAEAGVDLNRRTKEGSSAIGVAARNGHEACVQVLMRRGVKATRAELERCVHDAPNENALIALICGGSVVDERLLPFVTGAPPLAVLRFAGVPITDATVPPHAKLFARMCGAIAGERCPHSVECIMQNKREHIARFSHPADDFDFGHFVAAFADKLLSLQLSLIDIRAFEILCALQSLRLPALLSLMVIDAACPFAYMVQMHLKWKLVTLVKHAKDRK